MHRRCQDAHILRVGETHRQKLRRPTQRGVVPADHPHPSQHIRRHPGSGEEKPKGSHPPTAPETAQQPPIKQRPLKFAPKRRANQPQEVRPRGLRCAATDVPVPLEREPKRLKSDGRIRVALAKLAECSEKCGCLNV